MPNRSVRRLRTTQLVLLGGLGLVLVAGIALLMQGYAAAWLLVAIAVLGVPAPLLILLGIRRAARDADRT